MGCRICLFSGSCWCFISVRVVNYVAVCTHRSQFLLTHCPKRERGWWIYIVHWGSHLPTSVEDSGYLSYCCHSMISIQSHPWHQRGIFLRAAALTGYFLFLRPFSVNPRDGWDVVKIPVDQKVVKYWHQSAWVQQSCEVRCSFFSTVTLTAVGCLPRLRDQKHFCCCSHLLINKQLNIYI